MQAPDVDCLNCGTAVIRGEASKPIAEATETSARTVHFCVDPKESVVSVPGNHDTNKVGNLFSTQSLNS